MVSIVGNNVLIMGSLKHAHLLECINKLKEGFGNDINIIVLPNLYENHEKRWKSFSSASGIYVNMIVSNNAIYAATYNQQAADDVALAIIKLCAKDAELLVISLDCDRVGRLGGALRCLSCQLPLLEDN